MNGWWSVSVYIASPALGRATGRLDVEPEVHHVAVLDDVLAAFEAHLPVLFRTLLALAGDEVRIRDHLGADEPLLEIGVDHAGGLRRGVAVVDRPCADLLRSGGEVRFESKELVAGMDHAVETRFGQPEIRKKRELVLAIEIGDLRFERRAHRHDRRA